MQDQARYCFSFAYLLIYLDQSLIHKDRCTFHEEAKLCHPSFWLSIHPSLKWNNSYLS